MKTANEHEHDRTFLIYVRVYSNERTRTYIFRYVQCVRYTEKSIKNPNQDSKSFITLVRAIYQFTWN